MKVLIHDDSKKRRSIISGLLEKKRYEVTACNKSNDFINSLEKKIDVLLLDVDSWKRGKALYNYLGIPRKLSSIPIIFYNAPTEFSAIESRQRHEKDRILPKPLNPENLIASIPDSR